MIVATGSVLNGAREHIGCAISARRGSALKRQLLRIKFSIIDMRQAISCIRARSGDAVPSIDVGHSPPGRFSSVISPLGYHYLNAKNLLTIFSNPNP